jgi:hypothetical protein
MKLLNTLKHLINEAVSMDTVQDSIKNKKVN